MSGDEHGQRVTPEDMRRRLDELRRGRGYELEMHRIMARADPEWLQSGEYT